MAFGARFGLWGPAGCMTSQNEPEIRLLIVDHRRVVCEGLSALFATLEGFQAEAGGTEEVGWALDRFSPDVAPNQFREFG